MGRDDAITDLQMSLRARFSEARRCEERLLEEFVEHFSSLKNFEFDEIAQALFVGFGGQVFSGAELKRSGCMLRCPDGIGDFIDFVRRNDLGIMPFEMIYVFPDIEIGSPRFETILGQFRDIEGYLVHMITFIKINFKTYQSTHIK